MANWLVKTESSVYSIDDLARDRFTQWDGVRNYQARNFLRDMKVGDNVLIYHSVEDPVGVVGVAVVGEAAYPDESQFDKKSEYFDEAASRQSPRWFAPDLKFSRKFKKIVELKTIRAERRLSSMIVLQKGSRLSVQPVAEKEYSVILELAGQK